MAGLCKVTIIGNLGADPETRYTPEGKPKTSFRVACNRVYTVEGERREETEWFRVTAAGRLGEVASQYLRKGSKVYVEGRLRTGSWVGQDGEKRFTVDVFASDLQMLDSKPRGGDMGDLPADEHSGVAEDQIPF
ncbi:MAG TPA: single-stranded DNA-binding protein [Chloroflexota bacterium]|nr:single-stranded DNA-binding protein [Chloroflexota bacterium]HEX2988685.1 single-stranded DNA-binding protein [Chloroflexota bacterium]